MGYSQPAMDPTTVANLRLSPSLGAGFCVDAADVPLMVAIAILGVVLLPGPPPLPARAGATASVRPPATNANVSAIWRFIAASPCFRRLHASGASRSTPQGEGSTAATEDPDPSIG